MCEWINRYQRPPDLRASDFFYYNQITKQIAEEVRVELTADEELVLAKTQTIESEAIDAYMKGLFLPG